MRKRKIAIINEEKENEDDTVSTTQMVCGPMYTIMSHVQQSETFHKKYTKEMKELYAAMDHNAFFHSFLKIVKTAMEADDNNEYAHTTLLFCAKFVSSYGSDETHPLFSETFNWLLSTYSNNQHIRFRLCQFVNLILNALGHEAALEDDICDRILDYMLDRLKDVAPYVRLQAIHALQRLQVPDKPDDPVIRAYQFHLSSDPSPRVRQAVITCLGRNYQTIPYILDRLWDIDEKVRRHTYVHMSNYPVRSYKVSQRLTLLEQGLTDRSESVRKSAIDLLLKNWIETYQKNLITLIGSLRLDSNEEELIRFRKIAKLTLKAIFNHSKLDIEDLIAGVPLEEDGEFHRCVPHQLINVEIAIYWECLTDYLQSNDNEDVERIIPELSTFCAYIERYCQLRKSGMDKFEHNEFQHIVLSFVEMLYIYDLGDEIGRGNLKKLLAYLLKNFILEEKVIKVIILCAENLITNQDIRLQFFTDIVRELCDLDIKQNDIVHDRSLINELLANSADADINLKVSSLKVKILDLEEQEMNCVERKQYVEAQKITEERNAATIEYTNFVHTLMQRQPNIECIAAPLPNVVSNEVIQKCLQIIFHMVVSKKVTSLNPSTCKLYKDFICRHLESNQIGLRDWALKCSAAYSMLYEPLAKDVFERLYSQFFKNHNMRLWETSIKCIFELLARYGFDNFDLQNQPAKSKKSGRQLYNFLDDVDDDLPSTSVIQGDRVINLMLHFLDTVDDAIIVNAIIEGFCRLVLCGYVENTDIIEKLLLRYFNPHTDSGIHQTLGVFLECFFEHKLHSQLVPCLLPMVTSIITAPCDSPLRDIRPDTITRFIIGATTQEANAAFNSMHNNLAVSFLQEMIANTNSKELCKLLAKELRNLQINASQNQELKKELKELATKLINAELDPKIIKNIVDFQNTLDGHYTPQLRNADENESENEDETNANEGASVANSEETTVLNTRQVESVSEEVSENIVDSTTENNNVETVPQETSNTEVNSTNTSPNVVTTTTTFGKQNITAYRHLRKSLNIVRNTSSSENSDIDGPFRAPKIRIELRIDSDKKSSTEERAADSIAITAVNARRSLQFNQTSTEKESSGNENEKELETSNATANINTDTADSTANLNSSEESNSVQNNLSKNNETNRSVNETDKDIVHKSNQKDKTSPNTSTSASSSKKDQTQLSSRISELNSNVSGFRRRSRRRKTNREPSVSISLLTSSDESDAPDIITDSPTLAQRSIRNSRLKVQQPPKQTEQIISTSQETRKNKEIEKITTQLRNGRKRILNTTPLKSNADKDITASPLAKKVCREERTKNTPPRKSVEANNVEVVQDKNSTTPKVTAESPSSTKENEYAVRRNAVASNNNDNSISKKNKQHTTVAVVIENSKSGTTPVKTITPRKSLTHKHTPNGLVLTAILRTSDAHSSSNDNSLTPKNTNSASKRRKSQQQLLSADKSLRSKSMDVRSPMQVNEERRNSITTRNSAKKERQLNQIMTRKRLQHDNSKSSKKLTYNSADALQKNTKLLSKIPIRRKTLIETLSSKSNSTSTSSGSSGEYTYKLKTDLMRANMSNSKTLIPGTKANARYQRARSPLKDIPRSKIARYRRDLS